MRAWWENVAARLRRVADACVVGHGGAPASPGAGETWLTRFLVLRLLGVVYLVAFLTWVLQGPALLGSHGLLPIPAYLDRVAGQAGSRAAGFLALPSLFWLSARDAVLFGAGWVGVALSLAVVAGYANALVLGALCALQISIEAVGQRFYGFGWEIQLVETGFLCIFLVPLLDGRPFPRRPPPVAVVWLLRWLIVRIMWGAGLIKLRGAPCWRELTCLDYHFETQPIPNPLSSAFHHLPHAVHAFGVAFNHVAELLAPALVFAPRRARHIGAAIMAALQVILIASGNLAFLNWLTLVPILACVDDGVWRRVLPGALLRRADTARAQATPSRAQGPVVLVVTVLLGALSVPVVLNLASGQQMMNTSFTRVPLVNTYGAFGSVGQERNELIFEGTTDPAVTDDTRWVPYEWKCKPGAPERRPCWISPYHLRLDWLAWFAAMDTPDRHPWAVHLVWKLLNADPGALGLLAGDPFHGRRPTFVRVQLYRYRFAPRGDKAWWTRTFIGPWLPPLSRDNPDLLRFLRRRGWVD